MKSAIIILLAGVAVAGGIILMSRPSAPAGADSNIQNVSLESGTQIVEIGVRGGYYPRISVAKAGVPTVLRFKTSGSFDCSSVIRIPSLNISRNLPQTGTTDIAIGTPSAGTLQGMCAMGMYRFQVEFNS